MKILFVSAVLPYPLYSGGQVRIYNLLKYASGFHDITLCAFIRTPEERELIHNLDFVTVKTVMRGYRYRAPYLLKFLRGDSLLSASYDNTEMRQMIRDELQKGEYDLVHIEPFYVAPSIPENLSVPLVVAEHNVEYSVYASYAKATRNPFLRTLYRVESERIKSTELLTVERADHLITVSKQDKEKFSSLTTKRYIHVVPNGVDTDYFIYKEHSFRAHPVFLFVGDFKWIPNREMLARLLCEYWPAISGSIQGSTLRIVGNSVPKEFRENAADTVEFIQDVQDIRKEYDRADILLAPIAISGGSKYKILEAMASGLPVLTTAEGLSGLDATGGVHAVIANTSAAFVSGALAIIGDNKKSHKITQAARKLIESNYSWNTIGKSLMHVWNDAVR